jgi:hypothetical protein
MHVALDFFGIGYHLSALLLMPGAPHARVLISTQNFALKIPWTISPLQ